MKSYLINLDKDTERLDFFSSSFKRLGIDFERISAVDGRLFSEQDYQKFKSARPRNNKTWLRGQMGCFLSHLSAWEKIAQGDQRFCAVFEDDVHISDDLKLILDRDEWIPDDVDIIRLETSTNRLLLTAEPVLQHAGRGAYGVKSTSWCAGGYILNRRAAQRLVELPTRFHEPSDVILYGFTESAIAKTFNILQFNPAPCTQDKYLAAGSVNFVSNIESPPATGVRIKELIKKTSPLAVVNAIYKSLRGYQRISFK